MDASLIEEDGSNTPSLFIKVLLLLILVLDITLFYPLCFFVYYTLVGVLPTIAAASAANPSSYAQLPLSDLRSDVPPSLAKPREPSVFRPDLRIRPMLSELMSLRTQYKYLAFFRGSSISTSIAILEYAGIKISGIIAAKVHFGIILSVLLQFCWSLALVQLYALWTHTVLTHHSSNSLRQRILPFKSTLRATGPLLVMITAIRLSINFVLVSLMGIDLFSPILNPYQPVRGFMYATGQCIVFVALMPVNIILARVHASLLLSGERPISPLDEALVSDGQSRETRAIGIEEAFTSLGWDGWKRLGMLYGLVSSLATIYGGAFLWLNLRIMLHYVQLRNGIL